MIDVSVIILTKNEEVNIVECLRSIKDFAKRIIVVDSGSIDNTCMIASEMGADVYTHNFENYARQFNWAIDNTNIRTKWTLRLDADERLTPELCKELELLTDLHSSDNINGISMEAWLYFLQKKIKHGCRNKRKLMLFKTGIGRIEDRKMDEHTILNSGSSIHAKNKFIHYDFKDMTHWINKMNWYATREMQDYFDYLNGKKADMSSGDARIKKIRRKKFGFYYKLPLFFRCRLLFLYNYILKLGFLDGCAGFVYHYMYHCWYRTLVDSKILEQRVTKKEFEETGSLNE